MAHSLTTVSINTLIYQLLSNTALALHYASFNDLLKFVLSLASNPKFVTEEYQIDAKNQLASYEHINKMIGLPKQKASIHLRLDPDLKPYANDISILASLLFLNVTDFEPTAVFNLTESEIDHLMHSHKA